MKTLNIDVRRTRSRSSGLLCIQALVVACCMSRAAVTRAQAATASREARAPLNRGTIMPELSTARAPVRPSALEATSERESIRQFRIDISDAALTDLRRRI